MSFRLALRLAAVPALAFGLAACEEKPTPPPVAPPIVRPPVAPPAKRDFGGGYKGTKWGMSPAEVEALLGTAVERGPAPGEPDLERISFHVKDEGGTETKKGIDAYFAGGKLLRVVFSPHFGDDNEKGFEQLVGALLGKYGPPTLMKGRRDPRTGALVDLAAWSDGTTIIQLRVDVLTPEVMAAKKKADPRLFSTTEAIYSSAELAVHRDQALAAAAATDGGVPVEAPAVPGAPAKKP
jgi:hypothetical protein